VNGCNSLVVVALHAPQLSKVELQELGDLKGACLQQVRPSGPCGRCLRDMVCVSQMCRLQAQMGAVPTLLCSLHGGTCMHMRMAAVELDVEVICCVVFVCPCRWRCQA
jgi:hypothetical protein